MSSGSSIHRIHNKCTLSPIQVRRVDSVKVCGIPFLKEHSIHTTKKKFFLSKKNILSKYITARLDFTQNIMYPHS